MTWGEYFIVLGSCMVTMLACRVLPLFLLKGRSLPTPVERALGFISLGGLCRARRERPALAWNGSLPVYGPRPCPWLRVP